MVLKALRVSLLCVFLAGPAVAHAGACDLHLADGWVRAAPPGARVMAGYGVLRNHGGEAVVLGTIGSPQFASVELHETIDDDGVMRMRRIDNAAIPAAGELRLEPSGRHLMLIGPRAGLVEGDLVDLVITGCEPAFETRLRVRRAAVEPAGHDHHGH